MFPSQAQFLAPGFTPGGRTRGRGLRFSAGFINRTIAPAITTASYRCEMKWDTKAESLGIPFHLPLELKGTRSLTV